MLSISVYGIRYSSLYALLLAPSSEHGLSVGITPPTPLIMNRSDCHAAIPPPCLFSLVEASFENDMAIHAQEDKQAALNKAQAVVRQTQRDGIV
jgi:hypothetical protein